MVKEREIRERLWEYLDHVTALSSFAPWAYALTLDAEHSVDPAAHRFLYEVIGLLAEQSTAGYDEEDLRAELVKVASRVTVQDPRPTYETHSSSAVLELAPAAL